MRAAFQAARDGLAAELGRIGYAALPAEGTYFVDVDLAASGIAADDASFCDRAVREAGVAAIPLSAFYAERPVAGIVRLCFAKRPETLASGIAGLARARAFMGGP